MLSKMGAIRAAALSRPRSQGHHPSSAVGRGSFTAVAVRVVESSRLLAAPERDLIETGRRREVRRGRKVRRRKDPGIIDSQEREILRMTAWRKAWSDH